MATGTGNLPNQGMSFSPFAILTAEEMNDLVENIESLADGTGIGDKAIKAQNIDWTTGIWWEELGRTNTVSSNTLTVPIASPKKYLHIIGRTSNSSVTTGSQLVRLNGDAGNNYRVLYQDSGSSTGGTSPGWNYSDTSSGLAALGDVRQFEYVHTNMFVAKPSSAAWATANHATMTGDGRFRDYVASEWKNTTSEITSITLSASAGVLTGELIVLGHD